MAIKNAAASVVLGLLFASLIAIYLVMPTNSLVTFFSVVILAVSLVIALTGGWREIAVMGIFAGLVSLVAAYLLGQARFGGAGGIIIPLLWLVILLVLFRWISANILVVPKDRAILIANNYTGALHTPVPPLAPPIVPLVERRVATIPLYELRQDVEVKTINTQAGHNIDLIEVHTRYKVNDPHRAVTGIPNRGQVQNAIAKEMNQDLATARTDVAFWERVLSQQMALEVEDIVREIVYENATNAVDAYRRRDDLASEVQARLDEMVGRWGVQVTSLEFDHFEVAGERFKAINMDSILERETKVKRVEAEREAAWISLTRSAASSAEAETVSLLVKTLVESGVPLSKEDLEDIVISAIRASAELDLETEYMHYPQEPPPATKPEGAKGSNGSKK